MHVAKSAVLIFCRAVLGASRCLSKEKKTQRLHECTRMCFVYFGVHQIHIVKAYIIMLSNFVVAAILTTIDHVTNAHTWFLLNNELARTKRGERYMEKKNKSFFELDDPDIGLDVWSSEDSAS